MKMRDDDVFFGLMGIALIGLLLVLAVVGLLESRAEPRVEPREERSSEDDGLGLGMRYGSSRIGIEVAPGLVLDPSRGTIGPGFGF